MKIAIIIAFKGFRDSELFVPEKVFKSVDAEVRIVSEEEGLAQGADGGAVRVDASIDELNVKYFDAIVFIGGPGAIKYLDNERSYKIIREVVKQNKILGAICIAPVILAKAGVLKGKKATVWSTTANREPQHVLQEEGVLHSIQHVIQDGNIITANGPEVAEEFARKILQALKK